MERTVLTKEEIVEEIERALRCMNTHRVENNEGAFYVAQERMRVLSNFAYERSILNESEYKHYLSLHWVTFLSFVSHDEPTDEIMQCFSPD